MVDRAQSGTGRERAALELIRWHFEVDPEMTEIYHFDVGGDDSDETPISLLEVTAATSASDCVLAFSFPGADWMPYWSRVAEVTPEEMQLVRDGRLQLPNGWSLLHATRYVRENLEPYAAEWPAVGRRICQAGGV
ncbi:MAG TPA: hypothetical protein VGN26_02520 [Armatimonadota bacterium]|jgi:hypothetical protein